MVESSDSEPASGLGVGSVVAAALGLLLVGLQTDVLLAGDADLALHVALGRHVLAGGLPAADPILLDGPMAPVQAHFVLHEWGFEALVAALQRVGGWRAVLAVGVLLAVTPFAATAARVRREEGPPALALAAALGVFLLSAHHLTLRPHLVTWALLVPWVAWWQASERGTLDARGLALRVLPTAALWANLHGGFVLALGLAAIAVVFGPAPGRAGRAGVAVGAGLSTLVNPYGAGLWRDIAGFLSNTRVVAGTSDFQPLTWDEPSAWLLWASLVVAAALVVRGRLAASERVALAVLGLLALGSARQVPLYALVAAPIAARELGARLRASPSRTAADLRAAFAGLGGPPWGALWIAAGFLVAFAGVTGPERLPASRVPHEALHAVRAPGCGPEVLTDFQLGGWLPLEPGPAPSLHPLNALYPAERLDLWWQVTQARPGWEEVWAARRWRCALLVPSAPIVPVLVQRRCRRLLEDERAVVLICDPDDVVELR